MDFGALPPEINSGRMYSGPGSGPMHSAAAAWDRLADDLYCSAAYFNWVISGLTSEGWLGPSSLSMTAATAPYAAWMTNTAAHAEQAAAQARTAAAAYESAFSMVVPPPVVTANRALLASLASSSFFGQHAHTIAATEECYEKMWAQDASTMYRYAASSAAASSLASFTSPRGGTQAAPGVQVELSQLTSALPRVLKALAQPWQSNSPVSTLAGLGMPTRFLLAMPASGREFVCQSGASGSADITDLSAPAREPVASLVIGRARGIGRLSVPSGWIGAAIRKGRVTTMWRGERGSLISEVLVDEPETLSTGTDGCGDPALAQWAPLPRYPRPAGWRRA
jgi:hypothetical protein